MVKFRKKYFYTSLVSLITLLFSCSTTDQEKLKNFSTTKSDIEELIISNKLDLATKKIQYNLDKFDSLDIRRVECLILQSEVEKANKEYDQAFLSLEAARKILWNFNIQSLKYTIYSKLGTTQFLLHNRDSFLKYTDSIFVCAIAENNTEQIGTSYVRKMYYYSVINPIDSLFKVYYQLATPIMLNNSKDSFALFQYNALYAGKYMIRGIGDSANIYNFKALNYITRNSRKNISPIYLNLGFVAQKEGNSNLALEFYKKGLENSLAINDTINSMKIYYNIGYLLVDNHHFEDAKSYLLKAVELSSKENDNIIRVQSLLALIDIETENKNYKLAKKYVQQELEIAKFEQLAPELLGGINNGIAILYSNENKKDSAEIYFDKAILYADTMNDLPIKISIYNQATTFYIEQNNFCKAKILAQKAYKQTSFLDNNLILSDVIANLKLVALHEKNLDFVKELELKNQELQKKMISEKKTFEFGKKLAEINFEKQVLKSNYEINTLQKDLLIKNQNRYYLYIIVCILSILLFTVIFTNSNIQKKKRIIDQSYRELNQSKTVIQTQNLELQEVNNSLKNFAIIAAHDIEAPLNTSIKLIEVIKQQVNKNVNNVDINSFNKNIDILNNQHWKLKSLISDLLQLSSLHKNLPEKKQIDINQIVSNCISNLNDIIEKNNVTITLENLNSIEAHESLLTCIFLNIIKNAILNKVENRALLIQISCNDLDKKTPTFAIKDNGIGIEKTKFDKIFQPFERENGNYEGNGIGLASCKKIIDYYGGKIWIESEKNIGSTFYFTIPQ